MALLLLRLHAHERASLLLVDVQTALQVLKNGLLLSFDAVARRDHSLVLELVETVAWLEAPFGHCIRITLVVAAASMVATIRCQVTSARAEVYQKTDKSRSQLTEGE